MVEVSRLCVFAGRKKQLLKDVSFGLKSGEVMAVLGRNGSGKSTLLKALLGFLEFSGSVKVGGVELTRLNVRERAKLMAYVPASERVNLPFTLFEVVEMGGFAGGLGANEVAKKTHETLEMLGLWRLWREPFGTLSSGEKQLGLFCRALVQNTPLLVLDEPVSALDLSNSYEVLRVMRGLKKSVIFTTHNPEHCFVCDCHLLLKAGEVLAVCEGGALDVGLLGELYGCEILRGELSDGRAFFAPKI